MLEDADIVSVMRERLGDAPSAANLEDTAQALVAAANEAGGNDNITVVLVLVG
jgi:serine/threonine protein phosphatase PrpC